MKALGEKLHAPPFEAYEMNLYPAFERITHSASR